MKRQFNLTGKFPFYIHKGSYIYPYKDRPSRVPYLTTIVKSNYQITIDSYMTTPPDQTYLLQNGQIYADMKELGDLRIVNPKNIQVHSSARGIDIVIEPNVEGKYEYNKLTTTDIQMILIPQKPKTLINKDSLKEYLQECKIWDFRNCAGQSTVCQFHRLKYVTFKIANLLMGDSILLNCENPVEIDNYVVESNYPVLPPRLRGCKCASALYINKLDIRKATFPYCFDSGVYIDEIIGDLTKITFSNYTKTYIKGQNVLSYYQNNVENPVKGKTFFNLDSDDIYLRPVIKALNDLDVEESYDIVKADFLIGDTDEIPDLSFKTDTNSLHQKYLHRETLDFWRAIWGQ